MNLQIELPDDLVDALKRQVDLSHASSESEYVACILKQHISAEVQRATSTPVDAQKRLNRGAMRKDLFKFTIYLFYWF